MKGLTDNKCTGEGFSPTKWLSKSIESAKGSFFNILLKFGIFITHSFTKSLNVAETCHAILSGGCENPIIIDDFFPNNPLFFMMTENPIILVGFIHSKQATIRPTI